MNSVLFSSASVEWSTPQELFDSLDLVWHFDLDPCSDDSNFKCPLHFTKKDDGLFQSWKGHCVFCNPPYGKDLYKWVKKCFDESKDSATSVVALLPARTDTRWFHDFCWSVSDPSRVTFLRGRLKFGNSKMSAPFPSMLVYFI